MATISTRAKYHFSHQLTEHRKRITTYNVGNPDHRFGQAQICGNTGSWYPNLPFLITVFSRAILNKPAKIRLLAQTTYYHRNERQHLLLTCSRHEYS